MYTGFAYWMSHQSFVPLVHLWFQHSNTFLNASSARLFYRIDSDKICTDTAYKKIDLIREPQIGTSLQNCARSFQGFPDLPIITMPSYVI